MEKPKCKDCFWYANEPDYHFLPYKDNKPASEPVVEKPTHGYCHLRPPISGNNPWPKVKQKDFCRCFKPQNDNVD